MLPIPEPPPVTTAENTSVNRFAFPSSSGGLDWRDVPTLPLTPNSAEVEKSAIAVSFIEWV